MNRVAKLKTGRVNIAYVRVWNELRWLNERRKFYPLNEKCDKIVTYTTSINIKTNDIHIAFKFINFASNNNEIINDGVIA